MPKIVVMDEVLTKLLQK